MGDIINLNKARKARARADAKDTAKANRAFHGVTRAQKDLARKLRDKAIGKLDLIRREPPTS